MDYLWSPWRFRYLTQAPEASEVCVFCYKASAKQDDENFVLHRGSNCIVILNIYPYTTGHLMVAPYEHVADLASMSAQARSEMMELARQSEQALKKVYNPDGLNVGINLGKAAGAGVAGHVHMHLVPRWFADSNFMTTIGETRVIPEDLSATFQKLKPYF